MTPTDHGDIAFTLKMDNGREVILLQSEYSNEHGDAYFTQAYAMTIYSSQGLTVDGDVFVLYNSGMDRANTYVACSRHKDHCHLFINEREIKELTDDRIQQISESASICTILARQITADSRKKSATEIVNGHSVQKAYSFQSNPNGLINSEGQDDNECGSDESFGIETFDQTYHYSL